MDLSVVLLARERFGTSVAHTKLESLGANQLTVYPRMEDEGGVPFTDAQLFLADAEAIQVQVSAVSAIAQEIGLRKAIGTTQNDVLGQFLIEAIVLSMLGGAIGISIDVVGTLPIGWVTPLQPTVPVGAIVLAISVSGSIGLIFGVVPAQQAARLDPIVALRTA